MPIVESPTGLVSVRRPQPALTGPVAAGGGTFSSNNQWSSWGGSGAWAANLEYALIYATQPNVRTCVDFLARNIAQLAFHVFRRVSDTDRVRLADHQLAQWLSHPNADTTEYRLFESTVADLGIYFMAFWLKTPLPNGGMRLVRLPPEQVTPTGGLLRSGFLWLYEGLRIPLATDEVVYFNGYNPLHPLCGLSPLYTLNQVLAEDLAAQTHRRNYWQNSSRVEGVIERPREAPKWTPVQKQSWREQWQSRYTGAGSAGAVPVLEDGMTWKQISWSAKESEYLAARKLTREECAAAYHIPLPLVGILEHATFSNIKEQHKQLYSDTLGPWNTNLQQTIAAQVLPDCHDQENIYGEFNIAEKLKGSFEEQAIAVRQLVGRSVMTPNEARARLNLPAIVDDPTADQLAPQQGGPGGAEHQPGSRVDQQGAVVGIVRQHLQRQASRLLRHPVAERAAALDARRSIGELAADLTAVIGRSEALVYAARVTDHTIALLQQGDDAFAPDREVPHAG